MRKNRTILITGASGMAGQSLVRLMRSQGFENLLTPSSKTLNLLDPALTESYFHEQKPSYVVHLAGHIGGIKASITRPVEFMQENLMMAMHVIQSCFKSSVDKLLFVGSSCIYPRDCPQPMKEEHLLGGFLEPTNEGYALAKISGMKLCEYYNQQHGTNYLSLIPCNLYGEGDHFETEGSHVISALLYRMHQAKIQGDAEVVVWGTGNTRREFLFVDDFSKAILHFVGKVDAKQMQGFVNVGSGKDQSILDLAYMVKEVVGYPGELTFDATKPDGMPKKLMSITRAHDLGWKHETEIRDGLEVAYQWYLQNGADEIAKDTANI